MDDSAKIVDVQGWIKVGGTFENGKWVGGTWVKMEDVGLSLSDSGVLLGTPSVSGVVYGRNVGVDRTQNLGQNDQITDHKSVQNFDEKSLSSSA